MNPDKELCTVRLGAALCQLLHLPGMKDRKTEVAPSVTATTTKAALGVTCCWQLKGLVC